MSRATSGSTGLHGYTGERADPTSGLVYLRARDYSPGTARFVQPDPIQPNAEGTHGYNPFWYANANPATLTDPARDECHGRGTMRRTPTPPPRSDAGCHRRRSRW